MLKLITFGILLSGLLAGCASSENTSDSNRYQKDQDRPLVDEKYSLSADRKAFDEVRGQIPEDRKKENDELALILGMMSEVKKTPSEIRNQFDGMIRKRRDSFNKDMKKERDEFTKLERKRRDEFLKSQTKTRNEAKGVKRTREEQSEFFKDLDGKRQEFFSNERERRNDFESDIRERRKSFEDYAKEKSNEFHGELRTYQKRYDEWKKQGAKTSSSEAAALEAELNSLKGKPGTSLEAGE